jgi:hypothetical protein
MPGLIKKVSEGDRPSAERQNAIGQALEQHDTPTNGIVDDLGITTRPPIAGRVGLQLRWGKLDGALSAGSTATVSLWQTTGGGWGGWDEDSTENWTCYAPPVLSSGSIASGKWVLVGIVNGRKVVLLHEC